MFLYGCQIFCLQGEWGVFDQVNEGKNVHMNNGRPVDRTSQAVTERSSTDSNRYSNPLNDSNLSLYENSSTIKLCTNVIIIYKT